MKENVNSRRNLLWGRTSKFKGNQMKTNYLKPFTIIL